MTEQKLKPGWKVWRFDLIALNINERVEPGDTDLEYYVGLEHLDPDSLKIRRWGSPSDVDSSKLLFKKGDIIFGKRRVYQRKLGVAEFDGICSAHAMVLRPKTDVVLPEFLPFFMQSDLFMNRALGISVGSLSPTINWKTMAKQEFALPPLEEQRKLVHLTNRLEKTVESKKHLVDSSFNLFRSTIDATFQGQVGPSKDRPKIETKLGTFPENWDMPTLSEMTSKISDGVHKRPNYVDYGVPFLTVENLTQGPGIDFSRTRFVTEEDHQTFIKRTNPEYEDVLVSKDGTLGVARVIETKREFSIFVSLALLKPNRNKVNPWFLRYYFDSSIFLRSLASKTSGSALKHIHLIDFRQTIIPLPTLKEQNYLVGLIRATEKSYLISLNAEEEMRNLKLNILNHVFDNEVAHVH